MTKGKNVLRLALSEEVESARVRAGRVPTLDGELQVTGDNVTPNLTRESADSDAEARAALWKAIGVASGDIRHRFTVRSIRGTDGLEVRTGTDVPGVPTWRMIEALCLLGVLLRSEDADADVVDVLGKTGPVHIREDGVERYLWSQQTLGGERSSLDARPDLIVTSSPEPPHSGNAVRIIEAKCVRKLGAATVRSESGKAHDLRVSTYLIWSFYSPSPKVVAGAKSLGIDIEALGFDTDQRERLLREPEVLISRVAYSQEAARKAQRFAVALVKAGEQARQKLVGPL
jgi:hypothetical protein